MRNTIILCLVLASCAKEDYIEEVYTNPQPQKPIPEKEYESTLITINHSLSSDIWQGIDIAFNGAVNFIDDTGTESILLSPSYARWPLAQTKNLPTFKLKKLNNWIITDYYDNINMGMGGRSVTQ